MPYVFLFPLPHTPVTQLSYALPHCTTVRTQVTELHWPWSAICLGPSGAWAYWVIRGGRLYFLKDQVPKTKFLADLPRYVQEGDANWAEWFPGNGAGGGPFDTNCTLAHT
jgi:hypothetical protein